MITTLASRGRETGLIDLRLVELESGGRVDWRTRASSAPSSWAGRSRRRLRAPRWGTAGGRAGVFDGPGEAVYVPPPGPLTLEAVSPASIAVAAAPLDGRRPGPARVIRPGDQKAIETGAGNWLRTVRTLLGPDDAAGRLIVGETINPPGNWSSYPPHKHDREAPPDEVALEEVYYYRFEPAGGFGSRWSTATEGRAPESSTTATPCRSRPATTRSSARPGTRSTTSG